METESTVRFFEQALGILLMLVALVDVFLTVLYARVNLGIVTFKIARVAWKFFCWVSRPFARQRGRVLAFCGPIIVVLVLLTWALLLTLGTALIIHPKLGTSITANKGPTPRDFVSAMYAGGSSVSIVGSSDISPRTSAFRLFYLFNSFVGMSIISLTLTYLMQIYQALMRRNVLGLNFQLASAETGDAAELLAGLGPEGQFSGGHSSLAQLAMQLTQVKESHHFYPVLFYFRFQAPYYSVSRFALMALDTVTLIKSGLDDKQYGSLKESAAVAQLWRAAMMLVMTLEETFLSEGKPQPAAPPDEQTINAWQRRYFAGLRRLRQAGIQTMEDEEAGAATYVGLRSRWDLYIRALAPVMAYTMAEVDPAGSDPEATTERKEFRARLRFAD
jgi:hypothetical protein